MFVIMMGVIITMTVLGVGKFVVGFWGWGDRGRKGEGEGEGGGVRGCLRKLKSQFEQVEKALAFWRVLMGLISAG